MKILQKNKKAYFEYEILDEFQAGIMLTGSEVKSVRSSNLNLKSSYVSIIKGELFLKNCQISKYSHDQNKEYDPFRIRKLLLKKSEIKKMEAKLNTIGVSIIPLFIGIEGKYIKLQIALARGKKNYDKRNAIKDRENKRKLSRIIKNYNS